MSALIRSFLRRRLAPVIALLLPAVAAPCLAADAAVAPPAATERSSPSVHGDAIAGNWLVHSQDAIIHIEAAPGTSPVRYVGRIAWLQDGYFTAADGPALDGKPLTDIHNSESDKRTRPLLGLTLLWDLSFNGREWTGGRVYNSDNGHSYDCTVHLVDADHLRLHGYLGMPLLGGSTIWTRVTTVPPMAPAPGK